MSKYIDPGKLKKSISNYMEGAHAALNPIDGNADYYKGKIDACKDMQEFVTALQQEQPKVQNGKFIFPKYLYARTKDNKTIDMSYAPQDMTAVEYIRNDFVQHEQPDVDLEKEIDEYFGDGGQWKSGFCVGKKGFLKFARHFYERGMLNAMKQ